MAVYQRQLGEPVDLRAAVPETGKTNPYDYDAAIRRRLGPIREVGEQQSDFEQQRAQQRQQQAINDRLAAAQATNIARYADVQQQAQQSARLKYNTSGLNFNAARAIKAPKGSKWMRPVQGRVPITQGYGGGHHGIDYAAKYGAPVYAPTSGRTLQVGRNYTGFGNNVRTQFDNGLYGIFGHLSSYAPGLKAGQKINKGQLLGYVGSTGNSTGPHLHFEVRKQLNNLYSSVNPNGFW